MTLKNKKLEKLLCDKWFFYFLNTIITNGDIIKAFSYINSHWAAPSMCVNNNVSQKVDSSIQKSAYVSERWKRELPYLGYLHAHNRPWTKIPQKGTYNQNTIVVY
ncbi:MAG: hypothetical protein AAFX53_18990 [Bacteroidota bacterium]